MKNYVLESLGEPISDAQRLLDSLGGAIPDPQYTLGEAASGSQNILDPPVPSHNILDDIQTSLNNLSTSTFISICSTIPPLSLKKLDEYTLKLNALKEIQNEKVMDSTKEHVKRIIDVKKSRINIATLQKQLGDSLAEFDGKCTIKSDSFQYLTHNSEKELFV